MEAGDRGHRRPGSRRAAAREAARRRQQRLLPALVVAILGFALLVRACTGGGDDPADRTATGPRVPPRTFSLAQLAGLRVVHPFPGASPGRTLLRRAREGTLGGVVLFERNTRDLDALRRGLARLQEAARAGPDGRPVPVLVDQEGGRVERLPGAPSVAPPAIETELAARAQGRATATTLLAAGANVDLAPVADVPVPGSALEDEGRGFRGPPDVVGRLATAFARGLRDGGVPATVKHFPGFGRAPVNTDDAPVVIPASLAELRAADERPFAAAVGAGVELVMLSSAVYGAFGDRPAVLTRAVVTGELRGRLGFRGVTVTDDLETPALAAAGGPGDVAVAAAAAGADLLLYARTPEAAESAAVTLEAALGSGRLDRAVATAAARRVLALRARLDDGLP